NQSTKWLGVVLDKRLSFAEHVAHWTTKAKRLGDHLRSLGNTTRGPPPGPMREAVRACVTSVALYGAEAWYPGETDSRGRPTRIKVLRRKPERAISNAGRAAVPAYSTTPNNAILREAGIPPARVLLESARRRQAARIRTLDEHHPVVARIGRETRLGML